MRYYFFRRLLLIPPTLFGITVLVFLITRVVPGGPLERAMMEMQQKGPGAETTISAASHSHALSADQLQQLKEYYGFDKPWYLSYFQWLGKLLAGDLGKSYRYHEPVQNIIIERLPISLFFGLTTLFITYLVCIPLGIVKAIWHRTTLDNLTSILVFIGYAVPGYALGALLLLVFSARLEWFPMGGFTSPEFSTLGFGEQLYDLLHHAFLPLLCYLVGSFAITTFLMKNHLMENLAADYVRTAVAKGIGFKRAVIKHAHTQLLNTYCNNIRSKYHTVG